MTPGSHGGLYLVKEKLVVAVSELLTERTELGSLLIGSGE